MNEDLELEVMEILNKYRGNKPNFSDRGFNLNLLNQQDISEDEEIALSVIHERLMTFLMRPGMYVEDDKAAQIVTAFEYVLQAVWKFPLDDSYHRYQNHLEGCTCPYDDNLERIGRTNTRIMAYDCKFHGIKEN